MIFYFSGTGNSRWAAKLLGQCLNECIVSMNKTAETNTKIVLTNDEVVGFVFPVHGWRVPRIVSDFMRTLEFHEGNLQNKKGHYTFCLLTAGDTIGRTMERFARELKEVKSETTLELNAVESVIMPESYVGLPGMDVDKPEKELEKIKSAEKAIVRFASIVKGRELSLRLERFETWSHTRLLFRTSGRFLYPLPYYGQTFQSGQKEMYSVWNMRRGLSGRRYRRRKRKRTKVEA